MRRRQLLKTGSLWVAPALLSACEGEMAHFPTWRYARESVLELLFKARVVQGSPWNLPQVLQHLAQSIEFSIHGFPELKPSWFRATLGSAAFSFFNARGQMSHTLAEPIPGAPALDATMSLKAAVQRLLDAMDAFSAHKGEFFPHFAYGALNRERYERAHLMHLANHWQQLTPPPK